MHIICKGLFRCPSEPRCPWKRTSLTPAEKKQLYISRGVLAPTWTRISDKGREQARETRASAVSEMWLPTWRRGTDLLSTQLSLSPALPLPYTTCWLEMREDRFLRRLSTVSLVGWLLNNTQLLGLSFCFCSLTSEVTGVLVTHCADKPKASESERVTLLDSLMSLNV